MGMVGFGSPQKLAPVKNAPIKKNMSQIPEYSAVNPVGGK